MQNWIPNFNKLDITRCGYNNSGKIHFTMPAFAPKVFEVPVRQAIKVIPPFLPN
jgi:hypothetical protein